MRLRDAARVIRSKNAGRTEVIIATVLCLVVVR
jgi:hypothetical protein